MSKKINKSDIIHRLMEECDVTYSKAQSVYDCFTGLLGQAVMEERSMSLAPVGVLLVKKVKGKTVAMNFSRKADKVLRGRKDYYLDDRVKFILKTTPAYSSRDRPPTHS